MEVKFTREQEQQLAAIAARSGKNAEHLVRETALRLIESEDHAQNAGSGLPVLHLGAVKSLRRRDIYHDVR